MKTLARKLQKNRALTIHVTSPEEKYLRARKRETGLSISDIIREEYLAGTAETYFDERRKTSRNGHPAASDAPIQ